MKTRAWIVMAMIVATFVSTEFVFGIGGRGGGGGRPGGGFSGGARPGGGYGGGQRPSVGSSPSFSRPSAPSTRPSTPGVRPSSLPSGGGGSRPNIGGGNIGTGSHPSLQPGTRPNIGTGAGAGSVGSRPSQLPATRPSTGIGSGQGIANRPGTGQGVANRPGTGQGGINRPSQLPARLPGLDAGGAGSRLPNQGARVQDRMDDRPQSLEDRRANLSDRMSNGRQDWRDNNREDWQNWTDDKFDNYGDWYHDSWHPGAGWDYMWDNYPVASAIGLTAWGVNRIGYGWGYWGYSNPYYGDGGGYGYDYSQPLVTYADNTGAVSGTASNATPTETAAPHSTSQVQPTDEGLAAFEEARTAFRSGDYSTSLAKLDITLKSMPRDTVVHEFRSLVLFALKKYPESAAAIYAVLAAGPGWDWTTMISLYPNAETYTQQLRELEYFVKSNPKSVDAHFLLGYHYLTMGHSANAATQFKEAQAELPDDKLMGQLVAMTTSPDTSTKTEKPPEPPVVPPEKVLKSEQFVGSWKAASRGATFQLNLANDGSFTWTYSRGKALQSVKGVYAVDQNNLALETNDGSGTMLAKVEFTSPSQFSFKMIGDGEKDPGLVFAKGKF